MNYWGGEATWDEWDGRGEEWDGRAADAGLPP